MCCLFGMMDYKNQFNARQKSRLLSILAVECEARGTDATGIAYNSGGKLRVYKRPLPARQMRFHIPDDARVVMGHTRWTTQGNEKFNRNNHPFLNCSGDRFALAHNGVLYNDKSLRRTLKLPPTSIETDSYIAVQLIEQKGALTFDSLKYMAEQVEGSFAFTVLDGNDSLWFVKGDNPLCLYHYPRTGLFLYASTRDILERAIKRMCLGLEKPVPVTLVQGDILQIDPCGHPRSGRFDDSKLWLGRRWSIWGYPSWTAPSRAEKEYHDELKAVAASMGYDPDSIDELLREGFSADEIEELLYDYNAPAFSCGMKRAHVLGAAEI